MINKKEEKVTTNDKKVVKKKSSKQIKSNKKFDGIKAFIIKNKNKLMVSILFVIDLVLIIYFAKENYANYAKVKDELIFVGDTKNLLFGRNYIGLIVTLFIYFYGIIVSKFLCRNKLNIKWLVGCFIVILLFNMLMFYLFTNKIY